MRRRKLTPHLRLDELENRYRQAADPVERSQWQIIWLLSKGLSTNQVVEATGYSPTWISTIVQRYNTEGAAGVGDRRHRNPGAQPLLSPEQRARLAAALEGPAPDGRLWTSSKVARWMEIELGRPVHIPRGWELLQQLGYGSCIPRSWHNQGDLVEQQRSSFQEEA